MFPPWVHQSEYTLRHTRPDTEHCVTTFMTSGEQLLFFKWRHVPNFISNTLVPLSLIFKNSSDIRYIYYIHWTIVNIKHGAGITRGLVSMECVSSGIIISYRGTGGGHVIPISSWLMRICTLPVMSQLLRTISHSLNQFLASVCHLWVSR